MKYATPKPKYSYFAALISSSSSHWSLISMVQRSAFFIRPIIDRISNVLDAMLSTWMGIVEKSGPSSKMELRVGALSACLFDDDLWLRLYLISINKLVVGVRLKNVVCFNATRAFWRLASSLLYFHYRRDASRRIPFHLTESAFTRLPLFWLIHVIENFVCIFGTSKHYWNVVEEKTKILKLCEFTNG